MVWYEEKPCRPPGKNLPPPLLFALYFHGILLKPLWLRHASDLLCSAWGQSCFHLFLPYFTLIFTLWIFTAVGSSRFSPGWMETEWKANSDTGWKLFPAWCWQHQCEISEGFASQMPHKAGAVKMNSININMTFTASYFIHPLICMDKYLLLTICYSNAGATSSSWFYSQNSTASIGWVTGEFLGHFFFFFKCISRQCTSPSYNSRTSEMYKLEGKKAQNQRLQPFATVSIPQSI